MHCPFPYTDGPFVQDLEGDERSQQILCDFTALLGPIPQSILRQLPEKFERLFDNKGKSFLIFWQGLPLAALIGTSCASGYFLRDQVPQYIEPTDEGKSLEDINFDRTGQRDESSLFPSQKRPDRLPATESADLIDSMKQMLC